MLCWARCMACDRRFLPLSRGKKRFFGLSQRVCRYIRPHKARALPSSLSHRAASLSNSSDPTSRALALASRHQPGTLLTQLADPKDSTNSTSSTMLAPFTSAVLTGFGLVTVEARFASTAAGTAPQCLPGELICREKANSGIYIWAVLQTVAPRALARRL